MGDLILTFNAGSSTVKLGFYEIAGSGLAAIGRGVIDFRDEPLEVRLTLSGEKHAEPLSAADATDMTAVLSAAFAAIGRHVDLARIRVAAHRVVHGGDVFSGPARLTDAALAQIRDLSALAPLHQPQSLKLIDAISALQPGLMQTASFDTAFHATQMPLARRFALPRVLHDRGIKRYGFHGLSYRYIAGELTKTAGLPPDAKVVAAHLGSGASLCAMRGGESVDSSMGFSTLDGVPMATRCGALDPGVLLHLLEPMGMSVGAVETMLYRESGLLGVSGFEADCRELLESDRPEAAEAIGLFILRIAGEVARLAASLGGLDALVFTAGIGEHQPAIRAGVAERLRWLGLELDQQANARNELRISTGRSRMKALVIPTDEEQVIAAEALSLL